MAYEDFFMINTPQKTLFFTILFLTAFQADAVDMNFTPREIYIGLAAIVAGGSVTAAGAYYYHPASLEKKKLELEQEERKKKEFADHTQKERQRIEELHKLQAHNIILTIQHAHKDEIERIKKEKLHEKDALLTIIRETCGMKEMPINTYYDSLTQNIASLKSLENMLCAEKEHERMQLIGNLERIAKAFHLMLSDKARQEKEESEAKRRKDEIEQRKIEKEQLEIKKLRLEVDTIKETRHDISSMRVALDALSHGVNNLHTKETEHASEIINSLNTLRVKQSHDADEIKKTLAKTNERIESKFALLFKLFDQARQYVNQLVGQPQVIAQPQPSFNSELYPQGPMPAPSAPPL